MRKIVELDVGEAGLRYIEGILDGQSGLAGRACAVLPIRQGRVMAMVPEGTALERASEFRWGNLGLASAGDPWSQLAENLIGRSRRYPESSLISQDLAAEATDSYIRNQCAGIQKFFHRSAVYWFLNSNEFTKEAIEDVFSFSRGYVSLMFYVGCGIDKNRVINQTVGKADISNMAAHIDEIIISAYDDESFVIWRRQ